MSPLNEEKGDSKEGESVLLLNTAYFGFA